MDSNLLSKTKSAGRPTIVQIVPRLDTGGAELATLEIARAVQRAGGQALVLSEGGRLQGEITQSGATFIRFAAATKNPLRIIANAGALAALIKSRQVDLIHARSRAPAWSALMAARGTGIRFVTTYHGAYSENGPLKRRYNAVMARGDIVIANSHFTAGLIRSRYKTDAGRLRVIYRGVDIARFDPAAVAPTRIAALRKAWGVGPDELIILQAARLTSWKGHRLVIEAAGRLHRRGALGRGVVVMAGDAQGRDGYVRELKDLIKARGLDENLRLAGHCADMPAAFASAHVTIAGSDGTTPEAFGRACAEAQAAGCPVIAADFGAPPETVRAAPHVPVGEITGWLVPPGDVQALAARLAEALALAPAARSAIGARARRHIAGTFTAVAMQRQTLEVYDGLLASSLLAGFDAAPHAGSDETKT